jgi:hypothetical protein
MPVAVPQIEGLSVVFVEDQEEPVRPSPTKEKEKKKGIVMKKARDMKGLAASAFLLLGLLVTGVLAVPGAAAEADEPSASNGAGAGLPSWFLRDPSPSKGMHPLVRVTAISSTLANTDTEASCTVEAPGVPKSECYASAHGVGVASAEEELGYFRSLNFTLDGRDANVTVTGLIEEATQSLATSLAVAQVVKGSSLAFSFGLSNGAATASASGTLSATGEGTDKQGNTEVVQESESVVASVSALVDGVLQQGAASDQDGDCVTDTKKKSDHRFVDIKGSDGTKRRFLIWVDTQASVTACASAAASVVEDSTGNTADAESSALAKSSALARLLVFWEEKTPNNDDDKGKAIRVRTRAIVE